MHSAAKITTAAFEISSGIRWSETPQGAQYWIKVVSNLRRLARDQDAKDTANRVTRLNNELGE